MATFVGNAEQTLTLNIAMPPSDSKNYMWFSEVYRPNQPDNCLNKSLLKFGDAKVGDLALSILELPASYKSQGFDFTLTRISRKDASNLPMLVTQIRFEEEFQGDLNIRVGDGSYRVVNSYEEDQRLDQPKLNKRVYRVLDVIDEEG
ncbi:MAG: hypothetical protein S4CHLAM6_16190 [Chlamydiae bacterium]|nr:hypothetical protein [Chlamydiota bacterium]